MPFATPLAMGSICAHFGGIHVPTLRPIHTTSLARHRRSQMSAPNPKTVLAGLLRTAGHPDATLGAIELTGTAPVLPSSFAVDAAAQATIAAAALAASNLWRLRTGRRQAVSVDMRSAAIEFRSERY